MVSTLLQVFDLPWLLQQDLYIELCREEDLP